MIEELIAVLRENEKLSELTAEQFTDIFWLVIQQSRFSGLNNQELPINSQNNVTNTVLENKPQKADTQPQTQSSFKSQESQTSSKASQPKTGIYAKTASSDSQESKRAGTLPIRVPDAASLPNKLELARSLKSLMRCVPSIYKTVLDEVATTEQIANQQLWIPVLKPALEPWLELDLVVDEGASMLIWRDTILELRQLLENLGTFRNVRTWGLFTNQKDEVQIRPGIGSAVSKQYDRSPRELVNPNGRRLILVLSDCVSPMWRDGVKNGVQNESIISALNTWANTGPVAIVQMLPKWLWARTALSLAPTVQLSGLAPGVTNQQLQVKQLSVWDEIDKDQDIKVPVLTLEPEIVATWSQMVAGMGTVWTSGVVFQSNRQNSNNEDEPNDSATKLTAQERFQRFRLTASPMARRLAGLLAVAPVVTLPVIRLIQQTMLSESSQVHVAEVLLGGLVKIKLETTIAPDTNPDEVEYQFIDGVNEILLDSLPATDKAIVKFNLLEQLTKHIADKIGLSTSTFVGFLRDSRQIGSINQKANPIARVAVNELKKLGGEYAHFAQQMLNQFVEVTQLDVVHLQNPLPSRNQSIIDLSIIVSQFNNIIVNPEPANASFPQADKFERVVDLLTLLADENLTEEEITEKYKFGARQTQYYTGAGRYLQLVEKHSTSKKAKAVFSLTDKGRYIVKQEDKEKFISLMKAILEHEVFYKVFKKSLDLKMLPSSQTIIEIMYTCKLEMSKETLKRRASTVRGWIEWIWLQINWNT